MSKWNKIFACIQTFVILFLMICHGGSVISNAKKSGAFPCAGHQCGCKSEADCKTHCCCAPDENPEKFQNKIDILENAFHAFISSVNCKYGGNLLTGVTFTAKYILEGKVQPINESFLCFHFYDTSFQLPEEIVSPPEKPPRCFV